MMYPQERINTPISNSELERRWAAVRAAMAEGGIDVLLMQGNNDFLGGYVKYFTDLPATNGYPVTVVFPADDRMTFIGQGPFGQEVALPPEGDGLRRGVKSWMTAPSYAAAGYTVRYDAELAEKALAPYASGKIGLVGLGQISVGFMDVLRAGKVGGAAFVDASDLVDSIKAIKSPEELEFIASAAHMQDDAMQAVLEGIRPGMRDIEVAAIAEAHCRARGSEQGIFLCGSGKLGQATRFANHHQQNRIIEAGNTFTILIECNGAGGMYTELGRTCVFGRASQEMKEEFAFAIEAQGHTAKLLRPGASSADIWEDHNAFMSANGRPTEKRLYCHGQGYDMVERPLLRFDEPMPVAEDMNIAVHPTWLGERAYTWVCDNFIVTKDGARDRLHRTPQQIFEL